MIEKPTGYVAFDTVLRPDEMTAAREAFLGWIARNGQPADGEAFRFVVPRWHLFGHPVGRRTIKATWMSVKETS